MFRVIALASLVCCACASTSRDARDALPTPESAGGTSVEPGATPGAPRDVPTGAGTRVPAPGERLAADRRTAAAAPPGRPRGGFGVTRDKLYVGVVRVSDQAEFYRAAGVEEATVSDAEKIVDLVIADVNKRGGVAGRKVEAVKFDVSSTDTATADQIYEQACAHWTQDHRVFAAILQGGRYMNGLKCIHDRGALTIGSVATRMDRKMYQQFPRHLDPGALDLTTLGRVWIDGLAAQGYFKSTPPPVIGLLGEDTPGFRRSHAAAIVPALRRRGLKIAETAWVPFPNDNAGLADNAAQIGGTVLRMRSAGVTHMLVWEGQGQYSFFYMNAAESQSYRPRYGMHSLNIYETLADLVPHPQLTNAVGVGYLPSTDTRDEVKFADRNRCLKLMRSNGVNMPNPNTVSTATNACNVFWFLQAVGNAVTAPVLNAVSFRDVSLRLPGVPSPATFAVRPMRFSQGSGAGYRHVVWDEAAERFHYRGPVRAVP